MNALKKAKLTKNNEESIILFFYNPIISETACSHVLRHTTKQSDITYLEPYGKCVILFKKTIEWFHLLCQTQYRLILAPRVNVFILQKNYLNN